MCFCGPFNKDPHHNTLLYIINPGIKSQFKTFLSLKLQFPY